MKTLSLLAFLGILLCSPFVVSASKPDSLGLPGDNFDLYGALELFKTSNSPEAFEKAINANDNDVNNLDLNADGKVDYVKVIDKSKGDAHSMVLQVAISKTETQDVAVIELEKKADGQAHIQIVGDEELYGKNYIVEPRDTTAATSAAQTGTTSERKAAVSTNDDDAYATGSSNTSNSSNYNNTNYNNGSGYNGYDNYGGSGVVVNVWGWPSVQYMYAPAYVGWSSPWYWGYYPGWWQPWAPVYWGYHYRSAYRYHYGYYQRTSYYRCHVANNYYYGQRSSSETVRQNNRSGLYNQKQSEYRANPVATGHRYNSLPADRNRNVANREIAEQRANGGQGNNLSRQANNNQGQRAQRVNQPQGQGQSRNAGPARAAQSTNAGAQPRGEQIQQRSQAAQPRQMSQPRQQPRPQAAPQQRGGGMERVSGHEGGTMHGGGGGGSTGRKR